MKIRTAKETDWAEIIQIYNHAVDEKFCTADTEHVTIDLKNDWLNEHSEDSYPIFVSEINDKVTGWCSLSPYRTGRKALRSVAEISYYIHKNFRRKGIAKKLFEYTLTIAPSLGFNNLIAILLDKNEASINLLEKYGFEKWGHLPLIADFGTEKCGQFIYGRKI